MDGNKIGLIFEELEQICSQYKHEVPGQRRMWPKAIKDRVLGLRRLGVAGSEIAKKLPIPYMTILSWQPKQESKFLPVKVVESKKPKTTAVKASTVKARSNATITVVAPNGVRLEGVPLEFALSLLGLDLGLETRQ